MASYLCVPPGMCTCVFVNVCICHSKKKSEHDSFEGWVLSLSVEYRFVYIGGWWGKEWRDKHSGRADFRVRHPPVSTGCSFWWRPDSHWQTWQSLSTLQTLRGNPLWQALSIGHKPDAFPPRPPILHCPMWENELQHQLQVSKEPSLDGAHEESRYVILGCEPLGSYWECFFLPLKMVSWSPVATWGPIILWILLLCPLLSGLASFEVC